MTEESYQVLRDHGLVLLNALLVFFCIPIYMITVSPEDYAFLNKVSLFQVGFFCFSLCLLLFFYGYWILYYFKLKKTANVILVFLFFWILLSGYIFPLVTNGAMVDPLVIPTNEWNLFLVLLFSTVMTGLIRTRFYQFIVVFVIVFFVFAVLPNLYEGYKLFNIAKDNRANQFPVLSKENNIIVLSFDGLPGGIAYDLIAANPTLQNNFKDFIFFKNVIATSPGTTASITGELFGNLDLKKIARTQTGLLKSLNKKNLLINQGAFDTYTYHTYNSFNLNEATKINIGELSKSEVYSAQQSAFSVDLYHYVTVRIGSKYLLKALNYVNQQFFDKCFHVLLSVLPHKIEKNKLMLQLQHHQGQPWAKMNIASILDFNLMTEALSVGSSAKSARYMHFTFTHYPVDFDENCRYRSDDKAWYQANQNETGLINETKCALNKFSDFIAKLKALGIYDKSLIILKSDHGQPASYYSSRPGDYKINDNELWGYDRYRPMLLIKNYQQKNSAPMIKNELVLLDDLANTICHSSKLFQPCSRFPGVNLLGSDLSRTRSFYVYVVEDQKSASSFDENKSVTLQSGTDFLQMLKNGNVNVG